jgi:hypothetical protein
MTESAHKRGYVHLTSLQGNVTDAALLAKKSIEAGREGQVSEQHHPWAQGGPLSACSGARASGRS